MVEIRKWFLNALLPSFLTSWPWWTAGGAIMMGIITFLSQVPLHTIILFILISIASLLTIFEKINSSIDRNKKDITKLSDKEREDLILNWSTIPELLFGRVNIGYNDKIYFQFSLNDKYGNFVNIVRHKNTPKIISIVTEKEFDGQNIPQDLQRELAIEMARFGIAFLFENNNKIKLIENVSIDNSLTELYFHQRISFVMRAFMLTRAVYDKYKDANVTIYEKEKTVTTGK